MKWLKATLCLKQIQCPRRSSPTDDAYGQVCLMVSYKMASYKSMLCLRMPLYIDGTPIEGWFPSYYGFYTLISQKIDTYKGCPFKKGKFLKWCFSKKFTTSQYGVLQIDALFKDAFICRWNSYRRMIPIVLWLLYTDTSINWYLQRMPF